jgi:transcription antitermination factor NusG
VTDAAFVLPRIEVEASVPRDKAWIAIWTKARAEKSVARTLEARAISVWLPTVVVRRRWSDRWKEVQFVVFPGYVFARIDLNEWGALLRVAGVLTVVKDGAKPARIRDAQLTELRSALAGLALGEHPPEVIADFKPSTRVRVIDGPMAGLIGVVRQVRGKRRLLVGLEQIGHAVAVSIGVARVERWDD